MRRHPASPARRRRGRAAWPAERPLTPPLRALGRALRAHPALLPLIGTDRKPLLVADDVLDTDEGRGFRSRSRD